MSILMAARAQTSRLSTAVPADQGRGPGSAGWPALRRAGYDGKWVLHPARSTRRTRLQPVAGRLRHAENILDAYGLYTSEAGGKRGAAMLGDEMIDEASRKMALVDLGKAGGRMSRATMGAASD